MAELHTIGATISRWKRRFQKDRLAGLEARHKGSRRASPRRPCRPGSPGRRCRHFHLWKHPLVLPQNGGVRTQQNNGPADVGSGPVEPHRLDRYVASNDPQFEERAADVIGLYINPPQHVAVFCVDEETPTWAKRIHIFLDNLSAHKTKEVEHFLSPNPKVRFHFTPTYSCWLNQVELWFAKIQRDVISRGVFTSVNDLGTKIRKYIRAYSKSARPFRWAYTDPNRRISCNRITGTAY
jgi:hypothetical protein